MNDQHASSGSSEATGHETALRALMLGTIYATSIFFAVLFSPAVGVIPHAPTGEVSRIADSGR